MKLMTVQKTTENERKRPTRNKMRDAKREAHDIKFVAVDGEGITLPDGEHRYVLLGVGEDDNITNPEGLTWQEIFSFLWEMKKKHGNAAFVGFYLGYDFGQWLKGIPMNRARMLLTKEGKAVRDRTSSGDNHTPFPVYLDGWEIDVLGMKRFKLRPRACRHDIGSPECQCKNNNAWLYICDAGSFFQCSFLKAIDPKTWREPIVTPEEYAIILEGKRKRASASLDADMIRYNSLENVVLARLMRLVNLGFVDIGVRLSRAQWFGPGQAAQAWMKGRAPSREDMLGVETPTRHSPARVPWQALDDARRTYFGGWFEIFMHGIVPGISFEYDINSAYPHIIRNLPCLLHGKYEFRNRLGEVKRYKGSMPKDMDRTYYRWIKARSTIENISSVTSLPPLTGNQIRWVYARITGSDPYIGPMMHRFRDGGGAIGRPHQTTGWFWQDELEASARAGLIDSAEYMEWWTYTPCACPPPMRDVTDLYLNRLKVGKDTPMGKGSKTVYNSEYGKFAQTIGDPKFGNEIYASRITSGCRTQILNAIATHPVGTSAVCMIATDAVYFTSHHPELETHISEQLGDWSGGLCTPEKCKGGKHGCGEKVRLTLFKPGVYWDDKTRADLADDKPAKMKSRGINAEAFGAVIGEIDAMFEAWNGIYPQNDSDWPTVVFPVNFVMTTPLQALMRNDWSQAGQIKTDSDNTQNSNPHKADFPKRSSGYFDGTYYRSKPHVLAKPDEISLGYNKMLVISDPEQFDGVTQDGYVRQDINDALGIG